MQQACEIPQQNTPEWKAWRRSKVGASDAPVVMGVSPWKKRHQLWEEKLGLRPEPESNPAMARGVAYEEEARQAFESATGLTMFPRVLIHPKHEWMIASLDGISLDEDEIVEIKVPGKSGIELAKKGKIPIHYRYQMQHQLAVTGLKAAHYWVYDAENKQGYRLPMTRDDELIQEIIAKEKEFYEYLRNNTPPPEEEQNDYLDINDAEFTEAASIWKNCNRRLKSVQEEEKLARQRLLDCTDDGNCKGNGVKLTRMARQGAIDWLAVCRVNNIDEASLEAFRRPGIDFWKIEEE